MWYPTSIWQVIIGCFKKSKEKMMGILENQCKSGCFILWNARWIFMLYNITFKDSTIFYQVFRFPEDELTVNSDTWWTFLKMQDEMKTKCETLANFIKQNTRHKNNRKNKERGPKSVPWEQNSQSVTRGQEQIMFQNPPPVIRSISEKETDEKPGKTVTL